MPTQLKTPPYEDLIRQLENMLEWAKAGELQGISFCTLYTSGDTSSGWNLRTVRDAGMMIAEGRRLELNLLLANCAYAAEVREKILP